MKLKEPVDPGTALALCNPVSNKLKRKRLQKFVKLKDFIDDHINTIHDRGTDTPLTTRQKRTISKHIKQAEDYEIFTEDELQTIDASYRKALSRYYKKIENSKKKKKGINKEKALLRIIKSSRSLLDQKSVKQDKINRLMDDLSKIKYKHDLKRYPKLESENYSFSQNDFPSTLAEAYIWKMGDWDKFKNFESMYRKKTNNTNTRRTVHFAFAMHLTNSDLPIFDQNVLRSVLVIYKDLSSGDKKLFKSYLVKPDGKWKPTGESKKSDVCYSTYCEIFNNLATKSELSRYELDLFLMTLGRAIKEVFPCYNGLNQILKNSFG